MARIHRRAQEVRKLSDGDLAKEWEETYRRLFSLRLQWTTRQITNYQEVANTRRRIARLKTIQRQRQLRQTSAKKEEDGGDSLRCPKDPRGRGSRRQDARE